MVGHATFTGVVYLANLKIMTFSSAFSLAQGTALGVSFLLCILVWVWVSRSDFGVLEKTFFQVWKSAQVYVFFFLITTFALIDWAIHKIVGRLFSNSR